MLITPANVKVFLKLEVPKDDYPRADDRVELCWWDVFAISSAPCCAIIFVWKDHRQTGVYIPRITKRSKSSSATYMNICLLCHCYIRSRATVVVLCIHCFGLSHPVAELCHQLLKTGGFSDQGLSRSKYCCVCVFTPQTLLCVPVQDGQMCAFWKRGRVPAL